MGGHGGGPVIGPWHCYRYTRGKPVELVAIITDLAMVQAWVGGRRPPGEFRRAVRTDFGNFDWA